MGEVAEMMLEGILCEGCGEFLGDGDGFPTRCAGCRQPTAQIPGGGLRYRQNIEARARKTEACPECGKRFRLPVAVADHRRAKHGVK